MLGSTMRVSCKQHHHQHQRRRLYNYLRPLSAALLLSSSSSSSSNAFSVSSSASAAFVLRSSSSHAPPGRMVSFSSSSFRRSSSSTPTPSLLLLRTSCLIRGGGSSLSSTSLSSSALSSTATPTGSSTADLNQKTSSSFTTTTTTAAATKKFQKPSSSDGKILSSMTPAERLEALRRRMAELSLDVYIVPSDDPHLSEYTPDAYKRRAFLSGFQGSAGTAVVTASSSTTPSTDAWSTTTTDGASASSHNGEEASASAPSEEPPLEEAKAFLWTDSRYWNEAGLQLEPTLWTLQKVGLPTTKTIPKWLGELAVQHYQRYNKPLRVGLDPFCNPASFAKEVEDAFKEAAEQELTNDNDDNGESVTTVVVGVLETSHENLIDPIWGDERPPIPTSPFRVHPMEYAGRSVAEKVAKIRKEMVDDKHKKSTMAVFSALDDVAYLFNVRSKGDVDTCPVGIAYASITLDDVRLYCDPKKLTEEVKEHLAEIKLLPYDAIVDDIKAHCETKGNKVWMDKSRTNYGLTSLVPLKMLVDAKTAVTDMKAAKNEAEMEGMRKAHIVDGAAMAKFMAWLEHTIVEEGRAVSEVEIDEVLTGYRAEQPGYVELSFPTIAGVGPNGAIIHYRATEDSGIMRYLDKETPILIDSGGQYTYGTTDVTRSWHFGTPTPEYVDAYTRVLKGHIGLDEMIYPEGTPGFALDVYARRWLWDARKDYGHGTGHGVGAALNVHEGPISISPRWGNKEGLKAGMVVSNEPGYYEDGNFGIRIENLLEIQYVNPEDAMEKPDGEGEPKDPTRKKFLKFKQLTVIPIQKNLIDLSLMTNRELDWLDTYHEVVFEKVSPLLEPDSPAMTWLTKSCGKFDRQQ